VAVRLRLMRMGKKKQPTYRVVAADARSPRDGRNIDSAKAVHWLREGAQPSARVKKLLEVSGAWDDFKSGKTPEVIAAAAAKAAEAEAEGVTA